MRWSGKSNKVRPIKFVGRGRCFLWGGGGGEGAGGGGNAVFNNLSVISQRRLVANWGSVLTLAILRVRSIP